MNKQEIEKQAANWTSNAAQFAHKATDKAVDAMYDGVSSAHARAAQAIDALADAAQSGSRKGLDGLDALQDRLGCSMQQCNKSLRSYVSGNPVKTVALLAGVGAAVAALLLLGRADADDAAARQRSHGRDQA